MTTAPALPGAEPRAQAARQPRLRAVLREQLRATGVGLRTLLLVAAALAIVATILLAFQITRGDLLIKPHSEPSSLPGAIGALLAVAVWAREERFGPGFLWTLPVDRSRHALMKSLAGWLWLMGGVALFAVCQLVLTLVSGGRVLPVATLQLLAAPVSDLDRVDPAALRAVRWAPGAIVWLVPFVGATASYLLVSAFMLGIRRPLRWVVGALLLFLVASFASDVASRLLGVGWLEDAPTRAASMLVEGRYGLESLLTLRTWSLDTRAVLTTGERIQVWSALPDLAAWRIAALLWTGAGLLALWAAAWRHRERRRA
jgi:hypothetical protein